MKYLVSDDGSTLVKVMKARDAERLRLEGYSPVSAVDVISRFGRDVVYSDGWAYVPDCSCGPCFKRPLR